MAFPSILFSGPCSVASVRANFLTRRLERISSGLRCCPQWRQNNLHQPAAEPLRNDPNQLAIFEIEIISAPVNFVPRIARHPDQQSDYVAQWNQPEEGRYLPILQNEAADHGCHT